MKNLQLLLICLCGTLLLFSSCERDVSLEKGLQQIAEGSLHDSVGNCMPANVHGTYYTGVTPGSDTAYIQLQVDVTKTGTYSIITDLQNGLQFADSGYFTTTGENTILLKPIGIPIFPITSTFTVTFDSSLCNFTLTTLDSTGTGIGAGGDSTIGSGDPDANGSWQFNTDSGRVLTGTFDSVVLAPDIVYGGTTLAMAGLNINGDSALTLIVLFTGNSITPGTYYTQIQGSDSHSNAIFAFGPSVENADATYDALDNAGDGSNVGITITSYDQTTHIVKGTFSGKAIDEPYYPAIIGIQNGSFTATVSQ